MVTRSQLTRRDIKMIARSIRALVKIEERWKESDLGAIPSQGLRLLQARQKLTLLLEGHRGSTGYNIFTGEKLDA